MIGLSTVAELAVGMILHITGKRIWYVFDTESMGESEIGQMHPRQTCACHGCSQVHRVEDLPRLGNWERHQALQDSIDAQKRSAS